MKKKVIILGTGGNCVDILDTLDEINRKSGEIVFECAGFLDDDVSKHGEKLFGSEVLDSLENAGKFIDCFFVNGIGSPNNFWKKREIISKTKIEIERFVTVIHPTASVSRLAKIGRGSVIFQNVTVTSNASIGDHVTILPNSIISHDSVVGDYATIAGGVCVSGNVSIGESCYLGTNSAIRDGIKIGKNSLIGMGSIVLKDVPEGKIAAGNPAKILRGVL